MSPALPTQEPNAPLDSNPTAQNSPPPSEKPLENVNPEITSKKTKRKKNKAFMENYTETPSSSSAASSSSSASALRSARVAYKRRRPKVAVAALAPVRRGGGGDVEAIALPLGMSFAAVIAQVLERKDTANERMSTDHLLMVTSLRLWRFLVKSCANSPSPDQKKTKLIINDIICTSAVRESLANVFGDKFDFFIRNFEKSFGSTLKTLRLINESSINKGTYETSYLNVDTSASDGTLKRRGGCTSSCVNVVSHLETDLPNVSVQNRTPIFEEVEEIVSADCLNEEFALHEQMNQLVCAPSSLGSVANQLSTIEKSVMEQTRSNDLKTLEIGLTMKRLKLKEAQLALSYDSNHLERSKLAVGISKASFKAEKFKTQLEDTRHSELLRKCIDCLVAGIFIMSVALAYGTYVFSYKRITEATASCTFVPEESKSWWMPRPFSSFNSGLYTLRCQVQVITRMLFGILMILSVAYLLLQRSSNSHQTMPVTFILLLLGAICGLAGKLCIDTLGGSGIYWLLYWEALCLIHFLSNVRTSVLFCILHGPVNIAQGTNPNAIFPYWLRQSIFYAVVLLYLPLCCGLLPFASTGEWKDHFLLLAADFMSVTSD